MIARKIVQVDPAHKYMDYARKWYSDSVIADYFGNKVSMDGIALGYSVKDAQIALNLFARIKRYKDTRFNFAVANDGNFASTTYVAPANSDGSAWLSNLNIGSWALESAKQAALTMEPFTWDYTAVG